MVRSICPICLGSEFSDFRGRAKIKCDTCGSLERHRMFRLFMLSSGPSISNVILPSLHKFKKIQQFEKNLTLSHLDDYDLSSIEKNQIPNSLLFFENIAGFGDTEPCYRQQFQSAYESGALVAFTCNAKSETIRRQKIVEILNKEIESHHFNPMEVFGSEISSRCRLNMNTGFPGLNDIYYFKNDVSCVTLPETIAA